MNNVPDALKLFFNLSKNIQNKEHGIGVFGALQLRDKYMDELVENYNVNVGVLVKIACNIHTYSDIKYILSTLLNSEKGPELMDNNSVKQIPKELHYYWDFIRSVDENDGLGTMGLDNIRMRYHDELCEKYGLDRETTKEVTDNLDHYNSPEEVHQALLKLQKEN